MACANNPYITAVCECGNRTPMMFGECAFCGLKEGCELCFVYVNDKFSCPDCAKEQAYDTARCPQCNGTDLEYCEAPTSFEPHGERFDEDYCQCHGCGARFELEVR